MDLSLRLSLLPVALLGGALAPVGTAQAAAAEDRPAPTSGAQPAAESRAPASESDDAARTPAEPGFDLVVTLLNATGASNDALVELWREDPRVAVDDGALGVDADGTRDLRLIPSKITWPIGRIPAVEAAPFPVAVPGVLSKRNNRARLTFHDMPYDTTFWVEVRPVADEAFKPHLIEVAPVSTSRARHDLAVGLRAAGGIRASFDPTGAAPLEAAWIARVGAAQPVAAASDGSLRLPLDTPGETDVELLATGGGALYRALRRVDVQEGSWSDAGRVPLLELPPRLSGRVVGAGTLRVAAGGVELAHLSHFGAEGYFALRGDWPAELELEFEPADARTLDPVLRTVVLGQATDLLLEPQVRARPRVHVLARPFHARLGNLQGNLTWILKREGESAAFSRRPLRLGPAGDAHDPSNSTLDLGELEQGLWLLKVWDPANGLGAVLRFAVPPTDTGQRELSIELHDPGVRLNGTVRLEENGEPLLGDLVYVGLRPADTLRSETVSLGDGTAFESGAFSLAGLVPGETYSLYWFDARDGRLLATRTYELPLDGNLDVGNVRLAR